MSSSGGSGMTLWGMVFDAACHGLTTETLTEGKMWKNCEVKVNKKWRLRTHYPH